MRIAIVDMLVGQERLTTEIGGTSTAVVTSPPPQNLIDRRSTVTLPMIEGKTIDGRPDRQDGDR
jgi:hypothetical protein